MTSHSTLAIKRLLDIVAGIVILVVLAPLLLAAAAAVRIGSTGPIFFRQDRLGRDGRTFEMFKFRTMRVNAPDHRNADGTTVSLQNDPRVTGIGRILRRTSIDELPQLLNVVRGDMSLVGPRPELPDGLAAYEPPHLKRLRVRPGMTSLAVVSGRKEVPLARRRDLDCEYVDHLSLGLDLRIMLATVRVVVTGEGNLTTPAGSHDGSTTVPTTRHGE